MDERHDLEILKGLARRSGSVGGTKLPESSAHAIIHAGRMKTRCWTIENEEEDECYDTRDTCQIEGIHNRRFGNKALRQSRKTSRESIAKRRILGSLHILLYYYLYRRSVAARYPYSTDCTMHKDSQHGIVVHHNRHSCPFPRCVPRCSKSRGQLAV